MISWVHLYQWGDAIDVGDADIKRLGTPGIEWLTYQYFRNQNCFQLLRFTWRMRFSWACRRRGIPAWTWGRPRPSWSPWRWRRPDPSSSGSSRQRCPRSDRTERRSRKEISSTLKEKYIELESIEQFKWFQISFIDKTFWILTKNWSYENLRSLITKTFFSFKRLKFFLQLIPTNDDINLVSDNAEIFMWLF